MNDMLAAFHLVRYFDLRRREEEPCRDYRPEPPASVGFGLFRRWRRSARDKEDCA